MGQIEVYEWLKQQRLLGVDDYFSIDDIRQGLKRSYCDNVRYNGVRVAVVKLESSGYLEAKVTGKIRAWFRLFRIKKEYVERFDLMRRK